MRRRTLLRSSGIIVGAALTGGSIGATAAESDEREEPEPLEFDGEGVSVTDEFSIDGGPTVIEATHDGNSTFVIQFVPLEDGVDYRLLEHTGEFDGSAGAFVEEGSYVIYVDADGAWDVVVRQPRVSDDDAERPPLTIEGTGSNWSGPILFEETTRIAAFYEDNSNIRVEVVPQGIDDTEFVWNGSELVFDAIGPFAGVTSINTEDVGYIDITAVGDWTIELT
ncbi:hypothetical protein CV102_22275 [Natronococcus pandeyae]|uniref:Cell surface glycoprotein n=1 Tax=Natronococcus pandeyae TaxID=2055836 RepID=A0A8J8TQI4_9EURY|nr:hypothetical protein CV102_22275 [Natronococcus pandeyae]